MFLHYSISLLAWILLVIFEEDDAFNQTLGTKKKVFLKKNALLSCLDSAGG
jgi:hypothetical protein